jgi:Ca2+-binding RTX toxin-like protein
MSGSKKSLGLTDENSGFSNFAAPTQPTGLNSQSVVSTGGGYANAGGSGGGGGYSSSIYYAGPGNDTIGTLITNNTKYTQVWGEGGDDYIYAGPNRENTTTLTIIGGPGNDTVSFHYFTHGVTINRITDPANFYVGGWSGANHIIQGGKNTTDSGVENIVGSTFNDTIQGNDSDNILSGDGGDDTLYGFGGNDIFYTGGGYDRIDGGVGTNTLHLDGIRRESNAEYYKAGVLAYLITSQDPNSGHVVKYADGTATVAYNNIQIFYGTNYDDVFYGIGGVAIDGGKGINTLDYKQYDPGVGMKINLLDANHVPGLSIAVDSNNNPDKTQINAKNIGILFATSHDDVIAADVGDSHSYMIHADGGNDTINLGAGNDIVFAGNTGYSKVNGGNGLNTLSLDEASQVLADGLRHGVTITLNSTDPTRGTVAWGQDAGNPDPSKIDWTKNGRIDYVGFQEIDGTRLDDKFTGSLVNDHFYGNGGSDVINGGQGDDILEAGGITGGTSTVTGGGGRDTLVFDHATKGTGAFNGVTVNLDGVATYGNNTINFSDISAVNGSKYDDLFVGGKTGGMTIDGGAGNDTYVVGSGTGDNFSGGSGNNTLSLANDSLLPDGADIYLNFSGGGGTGSVTVRNTGGTTNFTGVTAILGSSHDDTFHYTGADSSISIIGGGGKDTLDYSQAAQGVTVILADIAHEIDNVPYISGISVVIGSKQDDQIYVDRTSPEASNSYYLHGGGGTDILTGALGDDFLFVGNGGSTTADGGADDVNGIPGGFNTLSFADLIFADGIGVNFNITDLNTGFVSYETGSTQFKDIQAYQGTRYNDEFHGEGVVQNEFFDGALGNDLIYGGSGNNTFEGGGGVDIVYGGKGGINTLSFSNATSGLFVDLSRIASADGVVNYANGTVTFTDIANFQGTGYDDTFIIGVDTVISGNIFGGAGNDTINFSNLTQGTIFDVSPTGSVTYSGHTIKYVGVENIVGTAGNDTFFGSLNCGIDGGGGSDTLDFSHWSNGGAAGTKGITITIGDTQSKTGSYTNLYSIVGTGLDDTITVNDSQNHRLFAGGGRDTINAGSGDDIIVAGSGTLTVDGHGGFNVLSLEQWAASRIVNGRPHGLDIVYTGNTSGTISGTGVVNYANIQGFQGTQFDDTFDARSITNVNLSAYFNGGQGDDIIWGGAGNDVFEGGGGNDQVYGGGGFNTLSFAHAQTGIILTNPVSGNTTGTILNGSDKVTYQNIFGFIGSTYDDQFNVLNDRLTIDGNGGKDTLSFLSASSGVNVHLGSADPTLNGHFYNIENVTGSNRADIIFGDDLGDYIYGAGGNDKLYGGAGNDTIAVGNGVNIVDGQAGENTLSFEHVRSYVAKDGTLHGVDITLNLIDPTQGHILTNNGAGSVDFFNIQNFTGTDYIDTFKGGDTGNTFNGLGGDDFIMGGNGNDTLYGGDGNGNDTINGGGGDDIILGGRGDDKLDGGSGDGENTLSFANMDIGVRIVLTAYDTELYGKYYADADSRYPDGFLGKGGDGFYTYNDQTGGSILDVDRTLVHTVIDGKDTLTERDLTTPNTYVGWFFNITKYEGSSHDDYFLAGQSNDYVCLGAGNDFIRGSLGDDKIYGGEGDDRLFAGADNDEVYGGKGNDFLNGGIAGDDILYGGTGDDTLESYSGSNIFYGGQGKDTFRLDTLHLASPDSVSNPDKSDAVMTLKDFHVGNITTDLEADVIDLAPLLTNLFYHSTGVDPNSGIYSSTNNTNITNFDFATDPTGATLGNFVRIIQDDAGINHLQINVDPSKGWATYYYFDALGHLLSKTNDAGWQDVAILDSAENNNHVLTLDQLLENGQINFAPHLVESQAVSGIINGHPGNPQYDPYIVGINPAGGTTSNANYFYDHIPAPNHP